MGIKEMRSYLLKGWKEPAADHMHVVQSDLDWLPGKSLIFKSSIWG